MCHLQWRPPRWDRISNQKHRKSNVKNWERSITTAWTAEGDETAQFDPNLTDAEIEKLELACVNGEGVSIRDRCHKRTYYLRASKEIGASAGEKTWYIYVEYLNSGLIHGWPITWKQLKQNKGVR